MIKKYINWQKSAKKHVASFKKKVQQMKKSIRIAL